MTSRLAFVLWILCLKINLKFFYINLDHSFESTYLHHHHIAASWLEFKLSISNKKHTQKKIKSDTSTNTNRKEAFINLCSLQIHYFLHLSSTYIIPASQLCSSCFFYIDFFLIQTKTKNKNKKQKQKQTWVSNASSAVYILHISRAHHEEVMHKVLHISRLFLE